MSDRDTIKAMLKRAGIEYKDSGDFLTVERGYIGFVVSFEFDSEGNLKNLAAYE